MGPELPGLSPSGKTGASMVPLSWGGKGKPSEKGAAGQVRHLEAEKCSSGYRSPKGKASGFGFLTCKRGIIGIMGRGASYPQGKVPEGAGASTGSVSICQVTLGK